MENRVVAVLVFAERGGGERERERDEEWKKKTWKGKARRNVDKVGGE